MKQQVVAKFPPADFTEEFIDGLGYLWPFDFALLCRMPDLSGRNVAKPQVGRQF